jgi:hypothetical protein
MCQPPSGGYPPGNHPNTDLTSSNFGKVTSQNNPRRDIQLATTLGFRAGEDGIVSLAFPLAGAGTEDRKLNDDRRSACQEPAIVPADRGASRHARTPVAAQRIELR